MVIKSKKVINMWVFDKDYNKWVSTEDKLSKSNYDYLKQELSSTRFYSKCLSGATYLPINNLDNIYDILGEYEPRNWFIRPDGSKYTNTTIPTLFNSPINNTTSYEYYQKYVSEYGLTLKNLFTPDRLIKDSINNYIYVDLATVEQIIDLNGTYIEFYIDNTRVIDGHRILVKDQTSTVTLPFNTDPNTYFKGNYTLVQDYGATIQYSYYNEDNGIYVYNKGKLTKTNDLEEYADCIRYSVSVKLGTTNTQKQFHLSRLLNGYYPTTSKNEPIEFKEKHNWLLRNRMDYNNLFEINYYDIVKFATQSFVQNGITYSIPERTISIGEFGIILNTQYDISTIVPNKYKVNLRSIADTVQYYWICGDDGLLLKVSKSDFTVEKVDTDVNTDLKSISFYNDLKGVIVGELNTILITNDGGINWEKLIVDDFESFYYNKTIFYNADKIFIIGNSGVFLELQEDISGWDVYKRRISRFIDDYEEYVLVDNIHDMYITPVTNWGLSFSYFNDSTAANKELMFLTTEESKVIIYDVNDSIPHFDFIFLDFVQDYGNINNIVKLNNNDNYFYFSWNNLDRQGISVFDLNLLQYIGVDNKFSNTILEVNNATQVYYDYSNKITIYNSQELLMCGNESTIGVFTYSGNTASMSITFEEIDPTFESRLKSKLLFLDYDVASRLNFFTDAGEYRLPNSVKFNLISSLNDVTFTSTQSSLIYSNSGTVTTIPVSGLTQSILPKDIEVNINLSNNNLGNLILNLKSPDGTIVNLKRVDNAVGTTLVNTKFTTDDNYTKFSLSTATNYTNQKFQMDKNIGVGESSYISNSVDFTSNINGNWTLYVSNYEPFTLNEVELLDRTYTPIVLPIAVQTGTVSSWNIKFVYGAEEEVTLTGTSSNLWFEPIIHSATGPSYLTHSETNWMTYWKDREKTFKYYADTLPLDESNKVVISTTFSYRTLSSTTINPGGTTNSIIDMERIAPGVLDNEQSKFDAQGLTAISAPLNLYTMYLYDYLMVLRVSTSFAVDLGDVIRIESSVLESNFVVNRIQTLVDKTYKLIYLFSNFNDNIITSLCNYQSYIRVINLNKYKTVKILEDNFRKHPVSNGYNLTYDNVNNTIEIDAKFNNLTSYYNLATNVFVNDDISNIMATMSYTDGFLKFGYTPTYNILDYLEGLNTIGEANPKFSASKEYLAMPEYIGIPIRGANSFTSGEIYIDYNGMTFSSVSQSSTTNKIYFGTDLKLEWESIFINTFVDVVIHGTSSTYTTERLLVMDKYINTSKVLTGLEGFDVYVIEFHKKLNYPLGDFQYSIDIKSRRKLLQISEDLQELNNIHRSKLLTSNVVYGSEYENYERDSNFKIPTDSYAKVLLSDVDTIRELSALVYVDYKNELAVNITRLEKEYNIPIQTMSSYLPSGATQSKLYMRCNYNHDLKTGDAVVLNFTGTQSNSNTNLNPQYFGYHNVTVLDSLSFYIDTPFGINSVDTGVVNYTKRDPFLNYEPVDIIDVGVDKRGKNAIEISIDNLKLTNDVYSLINVDFEKFRFRLVDGMTVETLSIRYPWILEAEITDAIIGTDGSDVVWYKGNWECGRWFGGNWISGTWKSGDWYGGTWNSQKIKDNLISVEVSSNTSDRTLSKWFTGRWYGGTWNDGTWIDGRWYVGNWNDGEWLKGIWNDGIWNKGTFSGGVWVTGTWNSGIFNCDNEPAYWIDGKWNGGDFENGMWYNGIFEQKNTLARFGTKAYNSRTARWQAGKWLSGSFYSKMLTNNSGSPIVSESHNYSIWNTGIWYSGDLYGGIVYNIDFKSGNWHGGISEEIQVIHIDVADGYILLNGIFKFNIGDEITVSETNIYFNTNRYKVIHIEEDSYNNYTKVFIDFALSPSELAVIPHTSSIPTETGIRIISRFRNVLWESGIWTNGIFETGLWKGGIWYNGIFGEKAKWQ